MGNCTAKQQPFIYGNDHFDDDVNKLCRLISYEHWQSAINRCERVPKEAMSMDADGCCALHIACYRDAPLDVIEALHVANPEAVKTKDMYGWLPLHIAMYHGMADRVLDKLKSLYPEALSEDNESQREKFYENYSKADHLNSATSTTATNDETVDGVEEGGTATSKGGAKIGRKSSNTVNCDVDPNDFKPDRASKINADGWLPIHLACYQRAGIDLIQPLHEAFKKGISKTDKHGWLPLHLACYHGASFEVIKFLIDNYPKGLTTKNEFDCLPIHLACESRADINVLKALCQASPESLRMKNTWKNLPIHRAVYQDMPAESIALLKSFYPSSVKAVNGDGETPLDIAMGHDWLKNKDAIIMALS